MCDNCWYLKEWIDVKDDVVLVIKVVDELDENYDIKVMIDFVWGYVFKVIKDFSFDKCFFYVVGKVQDVIYWSFVFWQIIFNDLFCKDIEIYGFFKIIEKGEVFLKNLQLFKIFIDYNYDVEVVVDIEEFKGSFVVFDEMLIKMLCDLCCKEFR